MHCRRPRGAGDRGVGVGDSRQMEGKNVEENKAWDKWFDLLCVSCGERSCALINRRIGHLLHGKRKSKKDHKNILRITYIDRVNIVYFHVSQSRQVPIWLIILIKEFSQKNFTMIIVSSCYQVSLSCTLYSWVFYRIAVTIIINGSSSNLGYGNWNCNHLFSTFRTM